MKMKNYGFYECNSSAQVMAILERLSVGEIGEVEKQYGCSGEVELAEQIMKSKGLREHIKICANCMFYHNDYGECRKGPPVYVDLLMSRFPKCNSDDYCGEWFGGLKMENHLDEIVRIDKVIEGVLKDINNSVGRMAD